MIVARLLLHLKGGLMFNIIAALVELLAALLSVLSHESEGNFHFGGQLHVLDYR